MGSRKQTNKYKKKKREYEKKLKKNPLLPFQDAIDAGHTTKEEVLNYLKKKEKQKQKKENREKYNRPAKIVYGHNTK